MNRHFARLLSLGVILASAALYAQPPPTFTVNSTANLSDAVPGDGVCETAPSNGICTLKGAIQEAEALGGGDIILPAGTYLIDTIADTSNGDSGLPPILSTITIQGAGAATTIIQRDSGAPQMRLFLVAGGSLTLNDVTVSGADTTTFGAGLLATSGNLTLNDCIFENNVTTSNSGGAGLAFDGVGTLMINRCIFRNNTVNAFGAGGGVLILSGNATIDESSFYNNATGNSGGGIHVQGQSSNPLDAVLDLTDSSIYNNSVGNSGGGMHNQNGTVTITNTTIAMNSADQEGSGIENQSNGNITILASTIALNRGITFSDGGGIRNRGTLSIQNTLLAGNGGYPGTDCNGAITSSGFNLIGNAAGCTFTPGAGDLVGVNPLLGSFTDDGTPGNGHLPPGCGSPAIDAASGGPATDQLGVSRSTPDIGAVEHISPGFLDVSVTKADSPDPAAALSNVTYTIQIANAGPIPATNAFLIDSLPPQFGFVSVTPTQGTCSSSLNSVTASSCALAPLYGAAHSSPTGPSTLYAIDPATGAATPIGATGFNRISAMAFDAAGNLFAGGERMSDATGVLISIDPCTGVGTEIGATGTGSTLTDLSFRRSDGKLFALTNDSDLGTVNTSTGAFTLVNFVNLPGGSGNAMAFSPADTLHSADSAALTEIDPATAALTLLTGLQFLPPADSFPRFNAIDFQPGFGILYGSLNDGNFSSPENYLAVIDEDIGLAQIIGPTQDGLDGLAFAPSSGVLDCDLGTIASGSSATVTLVVQGQIEGSFLNLVDVTTDRCDTSLSNNFSSQLTAITPSLLAGGDVNDDGLINAADLVALLLEINDGDGQAVSDVSGGSYPGTAAADVNNDSLVDLADLAALVLVIFGSP